MTIQKGWVEQRKHERVAAALSVSYRILGQGENQDAVNQPHYKETKTEHLPDLSKKFHVYHAITQDISLGGMSIMGDQAFIQGDQVEIILQLPQYKSQLTLLAKVIRTGTFLQGGKTMYSGGVQILAINQDDVKKLNNYLLAEKLRQQNRKK